MNRYIGAIVGVVVIFAALYFGFFGTAFKKGAQPTPTATTTEQGGSISIDLPAPSFSIPSLYDSAATTQAWSNFQDYLTAIKSHDLGKLKSLSYQLSPQCSSSASTTECYQLMDSAYFFLKDLRQADFKNVAYDQNQVVLSTDYIKPAPDLPQPMKTVLFFVRESGDPKMLAVKFCFGDEAQSGGQKCVNTDPTTRDQNNNGWWDSLESFFKGPLPTTIK